MYQKQCVVIGDKLCRTWGMKLEKDGGVVAFDWAGRCKIVCGRVCIEFGMCRDSYFVCSSGLLHVFYNGCDLRQMAVDRLRAIVMQL